LFDVFAENPKCKEKAAQWQLRFKDNPVPLGGYKFTPGKLVMGAKGSGERNSFDIE